VSRFASAGPVLALCLLAAACGSSKSAAPSTSASTTHAATTTSATPSPSALQGEAGSAATGDIPDNQVFVSFADRAAGYAMKYPEGWAQNGSGNRVSFRDKNNIVRVVVQPGAPATIASVRTDLQALKRSSTSLNYKPSASPVRIDGAAAIKVVYYTISQPNPVTNKRVNLMVDRYYLAHGGKRAVVDLGTPVGVDNVDAYRLMIQSFRWR